MEGSHVPRRSHLGPAGMLGTPGRSDAIQPGRRALRPESLDHFAPVAAVLSIEATAAPAPDRAAAAGLYKHRSLETHLQLADRSALRSLPVGGPAAASPHTRRGVNIL